MITFTAEQEKFLDDLETTKFKDKCFKHIKSIWSDEFKDYGEEKVWESIDIAIAKAKVFGIKKESDILRCLDLMYAISFNFDKGQEFEWIPEILSKLDWDPTVRLDLVFRKYKRSLKK